MNADTALHQRIRRLTPLPDLLAAIGRLEPVSPRQVALADAAGCVLAADVTAPAMLPAAPVALRDGWALQSEATRDAGSYAPLTLQPPPQRVDAFAALPLGTDAIAPLDAVTSLGGMMQVMEPVAPGEGVLAAGTDTGPGVLLGEAGLRFRASDVAALTAAGLASVIIRQPRIRIVNTKSGDAILDSAARFVARAVVLAGATAQMSEDLDDAMRQPDADAIIGIGGTGSGRNDRSVIALSRAGSVICHGIALLPGETSAYGMANGRPVLLIQGRIDAALACWLVLGRPMIDRLSAAQHDIVSIRSVLTRKVTSGIGIAEVVPLRHDGSGVAPLGSVHLSLQMLTRAEGWMFVPAESEGYPAGTEIDMRMLP